jgi:sugar lactone lactonase YvrE
MHRLLAALGFIVLAACGGGGSHTVPPVANVPAQTNSNAQGRAAFTITIPPVSAQAKARVQYISTNTQSMVVTLTMVNGAPFVGASAVSAVNLTPSSPSCSGTPLTCTVTVIAVAGNDTFSVSTYDAQQTNPSPAPPAGHLLSTAAVTVAVVAGQTSSPAAPLVLNGVPASITATFATDALTAAHVTGSQTAGFAIVGNQPYSFTFSAQDASGATIVGPGAPTLSSGSSAIALTAVNATTYTVQTKSYSAAPVMLSASTPVGTPLGFTLSTIQELWVANCCSNTVTGYALLPNCSPACTPITADTVSAGLDEPFGVAFDAKGNLWVGSFIGSTLTEYVPGTNSVVATISVTDMRSQALAFDSTGNLWVADLNSDSVLEFPPVNGATEINAITGFGSPTGLAFDASENLWVADAGSASVIAYHGTTPTGARISNGLNFPYGLAFDAQGNLWVANQSGANVSEYKPPFSAAEAPSATITSGIAFPVGIAFDALGNLYVTNSIDDEIFGYPPTNGATPLTGTPFATGSDPQYLAITP